MTKTGSGQIQWKRSRAAVEVVGPGRAGGDNRGKRLLFKIESNSGRLNHLTDLWLLLLERPLRADHLLIAKLLSQSCILSGKFINTKILAAIFR